RYFYEGINHQGVFRLSVTDSDKHLFSFQNEPCLQGLTCAVVGSQPGVPQVSASLPADQRQTRASFVYGGREVSRQRQRDSQRTAMALPWWLSYRETLLETQRPIDIPFRQRTATVFHSVISCLRRSKVYRAKIVSVAVSNHSHAPE